MNFPFVSRAFATILVAVAMLSVNVSLAQAHEPKASYTKLNINGWTVYLSSDFARKPRERKIIVEKIRKQTGFIASKVSAKHLKVMRKADIWVEAGDHYRALARHISKTAVYQENVNIDKVKDIEIFGRYARVRQPTLVLHELSHVYHDRKLKWQDSRIERLYKKFKSGMPTAKDRCGRVTKAYGLTNHHEFFATFTEAYFAKTCTYPYDRETIRKSHPAMHELLKKVWGF